MRKAEKNKVIKNGLIDLFHSYLDKGNLSVCHQLCSSVIELNDDNLISAYLSSIMNHALLYQCDEQFLTLILNMAIKTNNKHYINVLMENSSIKINLNIKDRNGEFPLFSALYYICSFDNNKCDIFNYLIEHGANININNEENVTLLREALKLKRYKTLNCLLKQPLVINLDMNKPYSPLIKAIYKNDIKSVQSLLKKIKIHHIKKRCNHYKQSPFKPLVLAYLLSRKDIFTMLLNNNSEVINLLDDQGYSILHYAILIEDHVTVKQLIEKGANPNSNI